MVCKKKFNEFYEVLEFIASNKLEKEKYVITEIYVPEFMRKEYILEYKEKEND